MPAKLIDGVAAAQRVYAAIRRRVEGLAARGVRPGLAAVQLGDNPASRVYVRNKMRACSEAGVHSMVRHLPVDCPETTVLEAIAGLNADRSVHGILVQLPLPGHLDAERITQAIAPEKDVDGFGWSNLGALLAGRPRFEPCTPRGVVELLDQSDVPIAGRHAVIVGRSSIVGKPLALLLLNRHATVTVCHSRTPDLSHHTRLAEILVVAVGQAGLISASMVKPGAAVLDVGINRVGEGKLAGDVNFVEAREVAGWITPVPGGVGPMTVAMLIDNTVRAAELSLSRR